MSSLTDDVLKKSIVGFIIGFPVVIGITILAIPFAIISLITDTPMIVLLLNLAVFVIALLVVGLLSRFQIIENSIVGLIAGLLLYTYFKWHSLACILVGVAVIGFLFFISHINIGFWIKTILFSMIVTVIVFMCIYSESGLYPLPDKIWKTVFFIVFFLENILIRCTVAHRSELLLSRNGNSQTEIHYDVRKNQSGSVAAPLGYNEDQTNNSKITEINDLVRKMNAEILEKQEEEESDTYLMERVYLFSQKKSFWDGSITDNIEEKIYTVLRDFIDKDYLILPHVAFREIFWWGEYKSDWKLTDRVTKMHFDFGIYNKELLPILFLEVHGKDHKTDPKVMERDKFKAEIMKHCGMKLITIDCSEPMADSEIRDKVTACIRKEVPDRQAYAVYCPQCKSLMQIKYSEKTKKYFYGCTTFKSTNDVNCPTINLLDVPPLYTGIPVIKK